MPAAGFLSDKIGPGKIVLTGVGVLTVGVAMIPRISEDTQ